MAKRQQDLDAERRAGLLVDLVRERLPVDGISHGPVDSWPLVGPALIARAAGSLEAIMALLPLERDADAIILLRSLYEHTTTFAWLAAEPGLERMQRWLKSDCVARIRADEDCKTIGVPMIEPDIRAGFERTVVNLPKEMPDLLDRAKAADDHWSGRVPGLDSSEMPTSFRGLYAFAYRRFSAVAHPSNMGMNFVTTAIQGGRERVDLETRQPGMRGPFGLAVVVFALGLYVAEASLGWPPTGGIDAGLTG